LIRIRRSSIGFKLAVVSNLSLAILIRVFLASASGHFLPAYSFYFVAVYYMELIFLHD
jgi:hypothetical protein